MFSGQKFAARVLLCTWLLMCFPTLPVAGRGEAAEPSSASSRIRPTFGWSEIPVFVKWEGKNAASYHIQYRIEGLTGWSDWVVDTGETSGLFQPPNSRITSETMSGWRIYFRCRARDFAGRWEEWGNGPDSFVVIEKSEATSTIRATQQGFSPNILVAWTGNRATCYNVQYRDDRSFEWKEWLSSTRNLSASFNGVSGHRYSFRCQARDQRGCWEAFCLNGSRDVWIQASAAPPPPPATPPSSPLTLSTSQTTVPRGTPARVGENGVRETAGSPPKSNVMIWRDMPSLHNPFVPNPAQLGKSPSSAVSTLPPSPPPSSLTPPAGVGESRVETRPASPRALAPQDEKVAQAGGSADLLVDPKDYGSSRRGILFSNYLIIWGVVRNQGALEARDVDLVFYEDGKEFARKTIDK
ncbi:MAG: hypothetical protein HYU64_03385, partial [Armatimonadetes bacterium]|nr:hypothetical protein [Armatimonadota bacterium]